MLSAAQAETPLCSAYGPSDTHASREERGRRRPGGGGQWAMIISVWSDRCLLCHWEVLRWTFKKCGGVIFLKTDPFIPLLHLYTQSFADASSRVPSYLVSHGSDPAVSTATIEPCRTALTVPRIVSCGCHDKSLSQWNFDCRKALWKTKSLLCLRVYIYIFEKDKKWKCLKGLKSFYKIIVDRSFWLFLLQLHLNEKGASLDFSFWLIWLIVVLLLCLYFALITAVSQKVFLDKIHVWSIMDVFHMVIWCSHQCFDFNNVPLTLAHTHTQNCRTVNVAVAIKYQKWWSRDVSRYIQGVWWSLFPLFKALILFLECLKWSVKCI